METPTDPQDPAAWLQGVVHDARGSPCAGAWVALRPAGFRAPPDRWPLHAGTHWHGSPVQAPPAFLDIASTDAAGRFRLARRPGRLWVQHPEYALSVSEPPPPGDTARVVLAAGIRLEGRVRGAPAGATVSLRSNPVHNRGQRAVEDHAFLLDPDGRFGGTGLPVGDVVLTVNDEQQRRLTSVRARLLPDQTNSCTLDLAGRRMVRVVVDGPDPERVELRRLQRADSPDARTHHLVRSARDARVWTTLVDWSGPGVVLGKRSGGELSHPMGTLELTRERDVYRLAVPAGRAVVSWTVERPASHLTLRLVDLGRDETRRISGHALRRRRRGRDVVDGLLPGRYRVLGELDGVRLVSPVFSLDGSHPVAVPLTDETVTTEVTVVDPLGHPRRGVPVEVRQAGSAIATRASTDAAGRVVFEHSPLLDAQVVTFDVRRPAPGSGSPPEWVPRPPRTAPSGGGPLTILVE